MNEFVIAALEPAACVSPPEGQEPQRESWWHRRRRPLFSIPEGFEALDDPEALFHQIDSLA